MSEWDELIVERYELCRDKLSEVTEAGLLREPLAAYFGKVAGFLSLVCQTLDMAEDGRIRSMELSEAKEHNRRLYEDIVGDAYDRSYANPDYITVEFDKAGIPAEYAKCLCVLYAELRALIPYAFEGRRDIVTIYIELFVEIYTMFRIAQQAAEELEEGMIPAPEPADIRKCIYHFESDNCELLMRERIEDIVDPKRDFAARIIMESDLDNDRYLYDFGEYISDDELGVAAYLRGLSDERIKAMADTYTQGYYIGFVKAGKPIEKKQTVNIRYILGFEKIIKCAIENFKEMGLSPVIYRCHNLSLMKGRAKVGYYGGTPNRQYEYDHKDDAALYIDGDIISRKLSHTENSFRDNKKLANTHAGPACMEVFGEEPFTPVSKQTALRYDAKQQKLMVDYYDKLVEITNKYIIGDERSFTIIAYPIPQIGSDFAAIFEETVKLNTLDYKLYEDIQQTIIDTLDKADEVHIVGKGDNETDLTVQLCALGDPEHETKFENCVADVNIPVGEVFTSPKLKGTNGLLHVTKVYLEGLLYKDLRITFTDGCISDYTCANYESVEQNRAYIKENILVHRDTLPLGEFAIGTNTVAYKMARRFDIEDRLPILIGEKTGPHFAVGDTCYSHEEDVKVYNPDGKEIIARENELSALRADKPDKAYFGCHTDITIPYDELGGIYAVTPSGNIPIIEDGRFVLEGCEELNKALDR